MGTHVQIRHGQLKAVEGNRFTFHLRNLTHPELIKLIEYFFGSDRWSSLLIRNQMNDDLKKAVRG